MEILFAAQKEIGLRRNKVTQTDLGLLFREAYFTERSEVYFHRISLNVAEPISTLFHEAQRSLFHRAHRGIFQLYFYWFLSILTFASQQPNPMQSIAEKKKSQNIGEYLIYMYQIEDLIRSYQGNMEDIKQYVITHYPVSGEEKAEIAIWFEGLLENMKKQEIMENGHLKELRDLVENLANIHWKLLKTDKSYFEAYNKAKPFILDAIIAADSENPGNEIQICINGIYGLLLCRLLGKKVEDQQIKAAEAFGEVLGLLNFNYQQRIFMSPN